MQNRKPASWLLSCVLLPALVIAQDPGKMAVQSSQVAPTQRAAASTVPTLVERGEYLSDAGNCVSCHTRPGGSAFAGGLGFETPFGTIYSTNITPDPQTGIGQWTAADLRLAMHEGKSKTGTHLFPAFPYTSFTKVDDADVDAIYAYLRTMPPIQAVPPANGWMFNGRGALAIWNSLFFKPGRFVPDARQSAEWNRGAYLTEGLGHCSACHTPRNRFMAETADDAYRGGAIQNLVTPGKTRRWSAVDLTSSKNGLASWSVNELTRYLKTGFSPRAGTFGPMNEVILNSLSHLKADDVHAIAVYLKSLPAREYTGQTVSAEQVKAGESVYADRCEKCHSSSGRGGMFSGPPLAGSAIVQAADPASLINIVLYGPRAPKDVSFGAWETMPSYDDVLDDDQVAAVANYVRGSWGNRAPPVSATDVSLQR